tara:strand:+ start:246 stop:524 length:279 start_codon:yes stop_codon:yes gene_type:complete
MSIRQMVASMEHSTYLQLKQAVELGKWPDGTQLSESQRAHSLQLVLAYDNQHASQNDDEPFRIKADGSLTQPSKKSSSQERQTVTIQNRRPE